MVSETGPSSSSEQSLAPLADATGDALAPERQAEPGGGPLEDNEAGEVVELTATGDEAGDDDFQSEVVLGQGPIDLNGDLALGPEADIPPGWAGGPETGAWSFEADEWDEAGQWAPGAAWEGTYDQGDAGEGWYDPGEASWDEAAAASGWYGQAPYLDEYPTGYVRSRGEALAAYQESYVTSAVPRVWEEGDGEAVAPPVHRAGGPWPELALITAVAVLIAAVILGVSSADKGRQTGGQPGPHTVPSAVASGSASKKGTKTPTTAVSVPSTRPTTPPTTAKPKPKPTPTAPVVAARSLAVTAPVKQSLIKSWLATNPGGLGMRSADVGSTVPGEVFYAVQPATQVFWAVAAFQPSAAVLAEKSTAAGQYDLAQFQNTEYIFNWKSGPYWNELGYVSTGDCPGEYVPTSVLAAWGLCGLSTSSGT